MNENFIPKITEDCLNVIMEHCKNDNYVIERTDVMVKEQPLLLNKIAQSAHEITIKVAKDVESDEYKYIFTNMLVLSIQIYAAIDKQLGIQFMEKTYG